MDSEEQEVKSKKVYWGRKHSSIEEVLESKITRWVQNHEVGIMGDKTDQPIGDKVSHLTKTDPEGKQVLSQEHLEKIRIFFFFKKRLIKDFRPPIRASAVNVLFITWGSLETWSFCLSLKGWPCLASSCNVFSSSALTALRA